jgi:hypothetical protein
MCIALCCILTATSPRECKEKRKGQTKEFCAVYKTVLYYIPVIFFILSLRVGKMVQWDTESSHRVTVMCRAVGSTYCLRDIWPSLF